MAAASKRNAGWVQGIAKDLQGFVRTNAARISQGS
jgi:hypothetical protein